MHSEAGRSHVQCSNRHQNNQNKHKLK